MASKLQKNLNLDDASVSIVDTSDQTKALRFECSGIAPATTRTLTVPDASGTIALTSDIGGGTPRFHFSTLFEDIARFNSVVAGSGTNTFGIYGNAQTSSATINNAATVAALVGINDTDNSIYVRNPSVTFGCEVTNAASGGGQFILLGGVVTFNGSGFSGTGRDWFGFRVVYTAGTPVLYATNGNNGTETQTDVTSGITLTNFNEFSAVMTTGTDIKFYINGTLVATHTTNLPSATDDSAYFQTGVSNTGTADEVAIRVGYADYSRDIL